MKIRLDEIFDGATEDEIAVLVADNPAMPVSGKVAASIKRRVQKRLFRGKERAVYPRVRVALLSAALVALLTLSVFGVARLLDKDEPQKGNNAGGGIHSLSELLGRDDFDGILWVDETPRSDKEEISDESGRGDEISGIPEPDGVVEWNGINLDVMLMSAIESSEGVKVLAVTVSSTNSGSLADFVYNGRRYGSVIAEYRECLDRAGELTTLRKFAKLCESRDDIETDAILDKLTAEVGEELIKKYFDSDKGEFDIVGIDEALSSAETELGMLEDEIENIEKMYYSANLPDLSLLAEKKGYYVVENAGVRVVFLECDKAEAFAADICSLYSEKILSDSFFRLASQADLGIEDTDEPDVMPGGVVTQISQGYIPDDVTTPIFDDKVDEAVE